MTLSSTSAGVPRTASATRFSAASVARTASSAPSPVTASMRRMGAPRAALRLTGTGGLGAIYPAMANSIVALRCLGYQVDDPLVQKALHEIEDLEVYDAVAIGDQRHKR